MDTLTRPVRTCVHARASERRLSIRIRGQSGVDPEPILRLQEQARDLVAVHLLIVLSQERRTPIIGSWTALSHHISSDVAPNTIDGAIAPGLYSTYPTVTIAM